MSGLGVSAGAVGNVVASTLKRAVALPRKVSSEQRGEEAEDTGREVWG